MQTVNYVIEKSFEVTDAEYTVIRNLYLMDPPKKVTAVRFLKDQYHIELKQAKDICDAIGANY